LDLQAEEENKEIEDANKDTEPKEQSLQEENRETEDANKDTEPKEQLLSGDQSDETSSKQVSVKSNIGFS
jgi:hypothetical protein